MTVLTAPYAIQELDTTKLEGADRASLARLHQTLMGERFPQDPPFPLALIEKRMRSRPEIADTKEWLARAGDEIVGIASVTRWKTEENKHWRDMQLAVRPEHRRRGIATALLGRVVEACGHDPEIVLGANSSDRVPEGGDFARRVGATEGLNNRTSELDLRAIDRDMIREWAKIDPAGYRLGWVDGDVPDELMQNVIVAYDTMNTAPRGNLQFGDWRSTAEEIRDWEGIRRRNGGRHRLLLAIHEASGATAGFTEIGWHPLTSWLIWQQGTAVVPEHRGKGIGKWIKGAQIERIFREGPDARSVRTGNAYSNAPMLSINDRMGFKVILSVMVWQLTLADAKRYLEARGL